MTSHQFTRHFQICPYFGTLPVAALNRMKPMNKQRNVNFGKKQALKPIRLTHAYGCTNAFLWATNGGYFFKNVSLLSLFQALLSVWQIYCRMSRSPIKPTFGGPIKS